VCDEWNFPHTGDLPEDHRAVAVLVALKDGSFKPDIGRYYGKEGWTLQFWNHAPVIGWISLPEFDDDTKLVEHSSSERDADA
jgi:hypothetical protein